jgi:pimeloyl-ACP methyl ester carboxylesterase
MDESQAVKMAVRLLEPCAGGVRWRWDERLRSRAGLAFHGTFDLDAARFLSILNDVRRPVTLVVGTGSEFVSQEQADRQLAELREGRKIALRGGHNLHLDCPAELADAISKEFIARSAVHLGRQSES